MSPHEYSTESTMVAADLPDAALEWQCRRGMRELDILLQRYLSQHFAAASGAHKDAFRALLSLSDPALAAYLLRDEAHPDSPATEVIAVILGRADA